ncbi:MAG: hypothetical protein BWY27_00570 [Bacteroidetes bacterium ADurb.Bin234]|jgi:hypothetical protein|nr:MAG: hypothetical protein BWY27_00570 [Bacteroidetes bacterium ADurb.Bin234]
MDNQLKCCTKINFFILRLLFQIKYLFLTYYTYQASHHQIRWYANLHSILKYFYYFKNKIQSD